MEDLDDATIVVVSFFHVCCFLFDDVAVCAERTGQNRPSFPPISTEIEESGVVHL